MTSSRTINPPTCLIGLGASAGGLNPLSEFLRALPEDTGAAIFVVLHLSPDRESEIDAILARQTGMPVVVAEDGKPLARDTVTVNPPGCLMRIEEGRIVVEATPRKRAALNRPIDIFFSSMAAEAEDRSIAVILSGTGTNGSRGARDVREAGGVVLAQDPRTADHTGMPKATIDAKLADGVAAPGDLAARVAEIAAHPFIRKRPGAGADRRPEAEAEAHDELTPAEATLAKIVALVRVRKKVDFRGYKPKTLIRRIQRRMSLTRTGSMIAYLERLQEDGEELTALVRDLLINVTGFLRDPAAWDSLRERTIRPLIADRSEDMAIRAWVPACASGEEAITLAILLLEAAEERDKHFEIKVFATDAAAEVLDRAREAVFSETAAQDLPEAWRERYFEEAPGGYRPRKKIRDRIVFAQHNLISDPPFSRLDIVSCRNVLIYLEPHLQARVIRLLHFSLRENGVLMLGSAETVGPHGDLFETLDKPARIYRRLGPTRHDIIDFPTPVGGIARGETEKTIRPSSRQPEPRDLALRLLAEHVAPPSVLIDAQGRILFFQGDLSDVMRNPSGEPSLDLLNMVRDGLRPAVMKVLKEARRTFRPAREVGHLTKDSVILPIRVSAVTESGGAGEEARLLVAFDILEPMPVGEGAPGPETDHSTVLERELTTAREELRATVIQLEVSNEELKASNEEITSMNEELQSTNEELETSKEELQSLNEELNTVNAQLQAKVDELEGRTDDLHNLLNATDLATLFLDSEFRVRWFTPATKGLLDLIPGDIGRPVSHFAQKFEGDGIEIAARNVLRELIPDEQEVKSHDGRWFLRRTLPYRTEDDRIDGVVMTFIDITERKEWEDEVAAARDYAERIIETLRHPLLVLDPDLNVRTANDAFFDTFSVNQEETEGRRIYDLGNGQWNIPELRHLLEEVLPHDERFEDYEVTHRFETIGDRIMLLSGRRLDHVQLILLAIEDVTERRRAELNVRASEERFRALVHATSYAVYRMSADWQDMMRLGGQGFIADTDAPRDDWMEGYIPAEDRADVWARIREAIEAKSVFDMEHRVIRADGSTAWTHSRAVPILDDAGDIVEWFGAASDVTERRENEEQLRILLYELNHRVKNTLTVVNGLAAQTATAAPTLDDFVEIFEGRVQALASANELLTESGWEGARLTDLLRSVTRVWTEDGERLDLDGPDLTLTTKAAVSLGLVVHELCTNAHKYGALKSEGGRVRISWKIDAPAEALILVWAEQGGPPVSPPENEGFGTELIRRCVRHDLAGETHLDWARDGLIATLKLGLPYTVKDL